MRIPALIALVGIGWLVGGSLTSTSVAQAPAGQASASTERTVWYFYRVQWGYQNEFLDLYQKNHYPIIKAQLGEGVTSVKTYVPSYHGDGRADWTFAVEMTFRDNDALMAPPRDLELAERLFGDLETFEREEQRRFEILDAHWDVPLNEIDLDTREMTR